MTQQAIADDGFSYDEAKAPEAFRLLLQAHPAHESTITSCMWMGSETMADGSILHHFKHRDTRNRFTFRPATGGGIAGTVIGRNETGEETADADAVLGALERL